MNCQNKNEFQLTLLGTVGLFDAITAKSIDYMFVVLKEIH